MALLTGATVMAVLRPLSRSAVVSPETATDAAFYKAQLAEIDRDAERGLIGAAEAEAAKAEAGRRLLAAAKAEATTTGFSRTRLRAAALAAVLLIPVFSLALYLRIGSPDEPDRPLEARLEQAPDFATLVQKVEKRLSEHPDDAAGWQVIAPIYVQTGRHDDAVRAYSQLLRLKGPDAERLTALGEVLVLQAGGVVTAEAKGRFDAALALDPKMPAARFYRGIAYEQDGRVADATAIFRALLDDVPPDSAAAAVLKERIAAASPASVPAGGEAIAALPQADREAAIRGMVEALDARLAATGGDAESWARLVRAFAVLKDGERARGALVRARTALAGDADALRRVEAAAREVGVE